MHEVRLWERASNYMGTDWTGWYSSSFGQHRDSDVLERANFQAVKDALLKLQSVINLGECGPDNDGDSIILVSENHWAVGWVEWIAIHPSNTAALTLARELCDATNDYPIVDEELYSRLADEECHATWEQGYDVRDRVRYFRRHSYTARSFAALLRAIRGNWDEAANMLHCPSDLLA